MEIIKTDQSVTTVVRHFIKSSRKKAFEDWVKVITTKASQFEGFEGLQLIPPPEGHLII